MLNAPHLISNTGTSFLRLPPKSSDFNYYPYPDTRDQQSELKVSNINNLQENNFDFNHFYSEKHVSKLCHSNYISYGSHFHYLL